MDISKKRIGIIGGGQLGKMMILEAKRLGFYIVTLDPTKDCPSHSISDEHIVAGFDDAKAYIELAGKTDVITYEFEHIHAMVLETLEQKGHTIYPSVASLKVIQNKYTQNEMLHKHGIPVPRFALADSVWSIRELAEAHSYGYPIMLKTTLGGYDGKGNALIRSEADINDAFRLLGGGERELMAEEFVDFEKEISIIACRGIDGSRVIYPAAENSHKNSILDTTIVPARVPQAAVEKATEIAHRVMEVFEGVGTFCVEMFVTKDGGVSVNEVAPRPHNSGHYTIEGCLADQFENHIRAITGLPLGYTSLKTPAVMINLIGQSNGVAKLEGLEEAYNHPNVHIHLYGKRESKKDRKMGHYTVVDEDISKAKDLAYKLKNVISVEATTLGHP